MSANSPNRLAGSPRPPEAGKVESSTPGSSGHTAPGVMLMVEAADYTAAQDWYRATVSQSQPAPAAITRLAPGLFYAQLQASGRYWIFSRSSTP